MTTMDPVNAEKIVLGMLMTDPVTVEKIAPRLTAGQFHRPRHIAIYEHLLAGYHAGEPVDPTALAHRIAAAGERERNRVGDMTYLTDLYAAALALPSVYVDHYLGIVLDAADRRADVEQGTRLIKAAEIADPDRRRQIRADIAEKLTGRPEDAERDSWQPLALGPYLRGEIARPEPTVGVARSDGLRFIYPGKEHSVIGEMEAGKSWFALACVAAELIAGKTVVYVHFEESNPSDTVERLQALGVHDRFIDQRLRFVAPDRPVSTAQVARLLDPVPSLAVLDGVNEGMSMHGQAVREEDGVAAFRRTLIRPFISIGSAVLGCDHVVKDRESRGRYALGSIHKGNALSGALIMLENVDPFGRGQRGRSFVYVTKDRPGHLRRHGRGTKTSGKTYMGEMVVDDRSDRLDLVIWPPSERDPGKSVITADSAVAVRNIDDDKLVRSTVAGLTVAGKEANLRAVRANTAISKDRTDNALTRLVGAEELIETPGSNKKRLFSVAQDPLLKSVP